MILHPMNGNAVAITVFLLPMNSIDGPPISPPRSAFNGISDPIHIPWNSELSHVSIAFKFVFPTIPRNGFPFEWNGLSTLQKSSLHYHFQYGRIFSAVCIVELLIAMYKETLQKKMAKGEGWWLYRMHIDNLCSLTFIFQTACVG